MEYKNIKKDLKKWSHVNVNVYKVKGNNLDQHGANAGSKLLQCYDPAVRTIFGVTKLVIDSEDLYLRIMLFHAGTVCNPEKELCLSPDEKLQQQRCKLSKHLLIELSQIDLSSCSLG